MSSLQSDVKVSMKTFLQVLVQYTAFNNVTFLNE